MSYAGVESDSEYAQRKYGLSSKRPSHCGDSKPHGEHEHGGWNRPLVCTGQLAPIVEQVDGKHKATHPAPTEDAGR